MTTEHTVKAFDDELRNLTDQVSCMWRTASRALERAVDALIRKDKAIADDVVLCDLELDTMQKSIEAASVQIIALRQPVAIDLRQVVGALRMATDLERVGDLAKNIAKRVAIIEASPKHHVVPAGFTALAEAAKAQLEKGMTAFEMDDADEASQVRMRDDRIDVLYNGLFRELLTYMMEDQRSISQCVHLLFCAKNLERVGDHATNLAETIEYIITGGDVSTDRPRAETVVAME
jgi:phosphate transport system protein